MWLRNFSLIQRLTIIVVLITLLFVALTTVVLYKHHESLKQKSYEENQHLVEVVHSMLRSFAARNDIDEATAKQQALLAVKALRYDGSNYFWIQDQTPTMIMHPIKPALVLLRKSRITLKLICTTVRPWWTPPYKIFAH